MKRLILLSLGLLMASFAVAQTQRGFVKTKGRMVNGQLVPGQGLPGATVNIQGGSSVGVKNDDGSFSFIVPARTFMVQSVQKKGYELVDPEVTTRPHQLSENALYLVMETPDQQMEDQLEAEEKISRTLREQLNRARREISRLRDENKITEKEYRQRINKLMEDQKSNKSLIEDMARQYARMDYDQMDSLNQRISDAILNGRLTEADSLLRSKGDMRRRIDEIRKEQQAEAQEAAKITQAAAELTQRQQNLDASKAGTQKKVEDIAADCYRFFDNFKLANQYDSAGYYIELRAELDTTNGRWLFDAALYLQNQKQFERARSYYEKALVFYRRLAKVNPLAYEPDMTIPLNNLAGLYQITQRYAESEKMHWEALEIRRRLAEANPQVYEPDVAMTLNNLAILYRDTKRFAESEKMYKKALDIYRRHAKANPQVYEPDVALTLNNLALLYSDTPSFDESEEMYREALEIYRRLAETNPQVYEPYVAMTLNNLALLYSDTPSFDESEEMYREALEIYRRLAETNPQAYEPNVALTLSNLANLYSDTPSFDESEELFMEALEIYRHLVEVNPQAYEPNVAYILHNLATLYYDTKRFAKSEELFMEALDIRRRLVKVNPSVYEPDLATTLNSLAGLYYYTKHFAQSGEKFREALEIRRRLAETNPNKYEPDLAQTLYNIGILMVSLEHNEEAIHPFEEALEIYRKISKANPSKHISYVYSLDYLGQIYALCKLHEKAYQIGEELLPIIKEYFAIAPEQCKSAYTRILGGQSLNCIFMKQFAQAEQYAREGLKVDSTQHFIYANLAGSLLFQGKYEEAEQFYRQYKEEYKDGFLEDFKLYSEAGVIPKEHKKVVECIKQMLEE